MSFLNKHVIVTGGLGFIGSNLAVRLAALGARVTVIDSLVEGCGGKLCNLGEAADRIEVLQCSIGDVEQVRPAIESAEVIFNLAGEVSHIHSMLFPQRDLEINTLAQLRFLQTCVDCGSNARIVYAGTRQVYGTPEYLPVDERHAVNPVDFNGVHKYAAAMYHQMLSRIGQLDAVVLRLTNVYGPRLGLDVPCQGFLSTYFRKVLTGQALEIFGDGRQLRDPVYVDDVVEAMLLAGNAEQLGSLSYNVGGPNVLPLASIAEIMSEAAGVAAPSYREFPEDRKAIDIGSYYTDSTLMKNHLGWRPQVTFEEGVRLTLAFYRANLRQYLDPEQPNPPCKLAHSGKAVKVRQAVRS